MRERDIFTGFDPIPVGTMATGGIDDVMDNHVELASLFVAGVLQDLVIRY